MLNDYMAEFRSLHTELQRLLDNAGVGNGSQAGIDSKMRELKGKRPSIHSRLAVTAKPV